jgi:hypothetical protein
VDRHGIQQSARSRSAATPPAPPQWSLLLCIPIAVSPIGRAIAIAIAIAIVVEERDRRFGALLRGGSGLQALFRIVQKRQHNPIRRARRARLFQEYGLYAPHHTTAQCHTPSPTAAQRRSGIAPNTQSRVIVSTSPVIVL